MSERDLPEPGPCCADEALPAVLALVAQVTDAPADTLSAGSRFEALDTWNSLIALRLLTLVEDRFGVRVDIRAYFGTPDVAGLAALVAAGGGTR
jgi:acyl carrier protein